MSSTEADTHTTEGWGIDWRRARTWVTLVSTSLQLALIAAMATVVSVGLVTRILPDWHFVWLAMWAMAGAGFLPLFLLYGWVIPAVNPSGEKITDQCFRIEDRSKAEQKVYYCWSSGILFAVVTLGMGLLAVFNLHRSLDLFTLFVAFQPALFLMSHGFPYVLGRLRQTAAKRPASDR